MSSRERIHQEFKLIIRNPISNCDITVELFNENAPTRQRVGPRDILYKGGLFEI